MLERLAGLQLSESADTPDPICVPPRYRTLFISDVHLGARGCQADLLLDFLRHHDADTIYLVGDIFDGWQLHSGWYWPQAHNDVVQAFLRKARNGTRIIYIPGNHRRGVARLSRHAFRRHRGGGVRGARGGWWSMLSRRAR